MLPSALPSPLVLRTSALNPNSKQKASKGNTANRSSPSCCAERNLLNSWIAKANKAGVPKHQVVHWIRRKAGSEITIWRERADGSLGCSVPCVVCAGVLAHFDLRVTCMVGPGEWYSGRLSDPGAPAVKATSGQRRFKKFRRDLAGLADSAG